MKTRAKQIENAVEEFRAALIKIESVNLDTIISTKFEIRQCRIAVELGAFIQALSRQIIPVKKQATKKAALEAKLEKLKKELGE